MIKAVSVNKVFWAAIFLVLNPAFSEAAESDGSFYGRIGAGTFSINDVSFSGSSTAYGVTVTAAGDFTFEPGYSMSGAVGYRINKNLDVELELGYAYSEYDDVSLSGSVTSSGTTLAIAGTANIDGNVQMFTGMGNLIYKLGDLMDVQDFTPYLGAGIGLVSIVDSVDKIGTLTVNGEETNTDIAANLMAGFDIPMSDSAKAGLRYRYFWADNGSKGVDNATAHALMATAVINF